MLWHNPWFNLTTHWTLDLNQQPAFTDTVWRSTEKLMNLVGNQPNLVYDLSVPFFEENTGFIFILLTMSCGFVTHKTRPHTTLLSKEIVRGLVLIHTNGCRTVTGSEEISTKSKPLFALLSGVFPLN